jgi:hypothetical protein
MATFPVADFPPWCNFSIIRKSRAKVTDPDQFLGKIRPVLPRDTLEKLSVLKGS